MKTMPYYVINIREQGEREIKKKSSPHSLSKHKN